MNYVRITIDCKEPESEILIALLADMNYEGFETADTYIHAYINEQAFDPQALATLLEAQGVTASISNIEKRNWNEEWERNFQPVIVEGFCTVRADFHQIDINTPFEIVITPKMSFGTGHHATTQLMMEAMRQTNFTGKRVLDFGTGTGILAILAAMLQAAEIHAVDNEEWACENARENAMRNLVPHIKTLLGSLENVKEENIGVLLANINRHVLISYMDLMYSKIVAGGLLLLSGILNEDELIIRERAAEAGFKFIESKGRGNWLLMRFLK